MTNKDIIIIWLIMVTMIAIVGTGFYFCDKPQKELRELKKQNLRLSIEIREIELEELKKEKPCMQ